MAAQQKQETMNLRAGSPLTGFFVGLIVAVAVAIPAMAAVSFATNPQTRFLFSGRLSETTSTGYVIFWWLVTALLVALPFLIGWAVTKLSPRGLAIVGGIVVVVVIVGLILGSMFVF